MRLETPHFRTASGAFTLIELLVASAVTILLLGAVFLITSQANDLAKKSTQSMDASREARVALENLRNDLSVQFDDGITGIIAGRVAAGAVDNSALAFLCRAKPSSTSVAISRVTALFYGIRLNADPTLNVTSASLPMLCRDYGTVAWASNPSGLSSSPRVALSEAAQISALPNPRLKGQVVARGVVRMEIVYVLADGTMTPNPPARHPAQNLSPAIPSSLVDLDLAQVKALIVAFVALDEKSLSVLVSRDGPDAVSAYAKEFASVTAVNKTPVDLWDITSIPDTIAPPAVKAATRIVQDTIMLQ